MQDRDTGVDYAGISWVRSLGYPDAGVPMRGELAKWWAWYRATGAFYSSVETAADGKGTFKVERITMNPAKMACEDWAGILFNYRTSVGLEGVTDLDDGDEPEEAMQTALDWMTQWVKDVGLLTRSASFERCFALGAYGFALGLDRVCMLLAGSDSIREVMAFPKTSSGSDLMSDAPAEVSARQLREVSLRLL